MRRLLFIVIILLIAAAAWQWQRSGTFSLGGRQAGDSTGEARGNLAQAPELRIEIVETAGESEARYREILARYGDDSKAKAWVENCMADAQAAKSDVSESWEYACWRSWADEAGLEGDSAIRR